MQYQEIQIRLVRVYSKRVVVMLGTPRTSSTICHLGMAVMRMTLHDDGDMLKIWLSNDGDNDK